MAPLDPPLPPPSAPVSPPAPVPLPPPAVRPVAPIALRPPATEPAAPAPPPAVRPVAPIALRPPATEPAAPAPPRLAPATPPDRPATDAKRTRSGWAVASLVQGVLGIVMFVLVVQSVLALVFGYAARREVARSDGRLAGRNLARTGVTLGAIGLIAGLLFWIPIVLGRAGDDASRIDVVSLRIGDCADVEGLDRSATAVPVVDCRGPHDAEVFLAGRLDPERSIEYPGDQPVGETVIKRCTERAFEAYVGRPFPESELDVFVLAPHASRWDDDGGAFACLARAVEGDTLVGSVRDSGR